MTHIVLRGEKDNARRESFGDEKDTLGWEGGYLPF
jgi:hypothetical protein